MTLRFWFFTASLAVAIAVAAAIAWFASIASGAALHRHDALQHLLQGAPAAAEMRTTATALDKELRERGVTHVTTFPIYSDLAASWNAVLIDRTSTVVASSPAYWRGMHVTRSFPTYGFSTKSGAVRSQVAAHLIREIPVSAASASLLFFPKAEALTGASADLASQQLNRLLIAAAIVAIVVSVAASALLAWLLLRPLKRLANAAAAMSEGDLSVRVEPAGTSELDELGNAFNTMARKLQRAEKLRTDMTADIAHELRTPLNNLRNQLEAIDAGLTKASPDRIASLRDEALRLTELVDDLAQLSVAQSGELVLQREALSPAELLAAVALKCDASALKQGVRLVLEVADTQPLVHVDVRSIRQVLLNIVSNAIAHSPQGGRVILSSRANTNWAIFTVSDEGSGIPLGMLDSVFERFVHGNGGGSGLGLAISKRIVEAHGGLIVARNRSVGGTEIEFSIPQSAEHHA